MKKLALNITYGPLASDAWKQYKDFRLKALKEEPEAFGAKYADELLLPQQTWQERIANMIFAFEGDQIVGMIGALYNEPASKVNLVSLYVLPEKRRQGIGANLIKYMVQKFEYEKIIELNVIPTNVALIPYYEKLGFEVFEINSEGHLMRIKKGHLIE